MVQAFIAAAGEGDLQGLLALLDPDVVLVSDGGGLKSAARRPVLGPDHVGRYVLGQLEKRGLAMTMSVHETPDGLTLAFTEGGVIDSVAVLDVRDDRVTRIWIMRNPEKLRLWNK